MKFGKRYSKVTVFMAMLHGVLIGVAAVALIGLLLAGTKGKDDATDQWQRISLHRVRRLLKIRRSLMKSLYSYLRNSMAHSRQRNLQLYLLQKIQLYGKSGHGIKANDKY